MLGTPRSNSQVREDLLYTAKEQECFKQRREISEDRAKLDELRSKCRIREETYKIEIDKLRQKLDKIRYKFEQQQKYRQNSSEMQRIKEENTFLRSQVQFQKQQLHQSFQLSNLLHTSRETSANKRAQTSRSGLPEKLNANQSVNSSSSEKDKCMDDQGATKSKGSDMELVKVVQHKLLKDNKILKRRVDLMQCQMREIFELLIEEKIAGKETSRERQQLQQQKQHPQHHHQEKHYHQQQPHQNKHEKKDTHQISPEKGNELAAFKERVESTKREFQKKVKQVFQKHQNQNDIFEKKNQQLTLISKQLLFDEGNDEDTSKIDQESSSSIASSSAAMSCQPPEEYDIDNQFNRDHNENIEKDMMLDQKEYMDDHFVGKGKKDDLSNGGIQEGENSLLKKKTHINPRSWKETLVEDESKNETSQEDKNLAMNTQDQQYQHSQENQQELQQQYQQLHNKLEREEETKDDYDLIRVEEEDGEVFQEKERRKQLGEQMKKQLQKKKTTHIPHNNHSNRMGVESMDTLWSWRKTPVLSIPEPTSGRGIFRGGFENARKQNEYRSIKEQYQTILNKNSSSCKNTQKSINSGYTSALQFGVDSIIPRRQDPILSRPYTTTVSPSSHKINENNQNSLANVNTNILNGKMNSIQSSMNEICEGASAMTCISSRFGGFTDRGATGRNVESELIGNSIQVSPLRDISAIPSLTTRREEGTQQPSQVHSLHFPAGSKKDGSMTARNYDQNDNSDKVTDEYIRQIIQQYKTPKKAQQQQQQAANQKKMLLLPSTIPISGNQFVYDKRESANLVKDSCNLGRESQRIHISKEQNSLPLPATGNNPLQSQTLTNSPNKGTVKHQKLSIQAPSSLAATIIHNSSANAYTKDPNIYNCYFNNLNNNSANNLIQPLTYGLTNATQSYNSQNISNPIHSYTPSNPTTHPLPSSSTNHNSYNPVQTYNCGNLASQNYNNEGNQNYATNPYSQQQSSLNSNAISNNSPTNKKIMIQQPQQNTNSTTSNNVGTAMANINSSNTNREQANINHKRQQSCGGAGGINKYNLKLNLTSLLTPKASIIVQTDRQYSDRTAYTRLVPKPSNVISSNITPKYSPHHSSQTTSVNKFYKK